MSGEERNARGVVHDCPWCGETYPPALDGRFEETGCHLECWWQAVEYAYHGIAVIERWLTAFTGEEPLQ